MQVDFTLSAKAKNTSKSRIENTRISAGTFMVKVENNDGEPIVLQRKIDQSLIQFYFGIEGGATFLFNQGNYRLALKTAHSLLFYNPVVALPLEIQVLPKSKLMFLYTTVEELHQQLVAESDEIAFLNKDNIDNKYYTDANLSPAIMVALSQLFTTKVNGPAAGLFNKAKALEILALYFNREEGIDAEQCPFLNDEENVERIRQAKKLIIENMATPPTLKELSRLIGLNEYRLKEGFKNIYGKTVFQFLNDYRLDVARHFLDEGSTKVNDAAYKIGYTNPSHFIAAFKKKFGVTPKKYLTGKVRT
jgi:AraC-like DNA-binding protein